MATVRVRITDRQRQAILNDPRAKAYLKRKADDLARAIKTNLNTDAPFGTGELAQTVEVEETRTGQKVTVGDSTHEYAQAQEFGAGAHIIRGKPKLAFQWIARNVFVVTDQVNHPGNRAKNYTLRAL